MDTGILVRQYDQACVARGWRLTSDVQELVQAALGAGMRWMIREGHPQAHAHWPAGKGRVYLAFSPTRENHWSLAIDSYDVRSGQYRHGVFYGKYAAQFEAAGVPFEFEKRNRGAGHMVVKREALLETVSKLGAMDHSVLYFSRSATPTLGFGTEYDIQRAMIQSWSDTPFGKSATLIGDEVPVESTSNPRRIDLLAHDMVADHFFIIELKRAEAPIESVDQVLGYVASLNSHPEFIGKTITAVLVAERVPEHVRAIAREVGVVAYEITWPLDFIRVV